MSGRQAKQRITLIRCVEVSIGNKFKLRYWEGGGRQFTGRACHMRALKAARQESLNP